jgi:hypothetical protein
VARPPDEVLSDIGRGFDPDAFDALCDTTYEGSYTVREGQAVKEVPIAPWRKAACLAWDLEEILIFLNNLGDEWICERGCRVNENGSGNVHYTFAHKADRDVRVYVRWPIIEDPIVSHAAKVPTVTVSEHWVSLGFEGEREREPGDGPARRIPWHIQSPVPQIWQSWRTHAREYRDFKRRRTTNLQDTVFIKFGGKLSPRATSTWIWQNELLLLHDREDFSGPLRYFVKTYPPHLIGPQQIILERLRDALFWTRKGKAAEKSVTAFLDRAGFLELILTPVEGPHDHREQYEWAGTKYAIHGGYWVHPKAQVILARHDIDGLVMDTTFKVIRRYHLAILVAVWHNVGIPLAVSFGPRENIELYDRFYTVFQERFQIDLTRYTLESDQGAALKAVGARHLRHLFCLRHVLKTLHKDGGRFASLVGNLISARTKKDLGLLVTLYTPEFTTVMQAGGVEWDQLRKCLDKVGLRFEAGRIRYADAHRTR